MRVLGGAFLIAGTAIGGGMLALPLLTGLCGFIPACLLIFVCWAVSTYTAFLTIEVNLWFLANEDHVNITTMARHTLGHVSQKVISILQLLFLYTLTAAFITGGSTVITQAFPHDSWLQWVILAIFWSTLFLGTRTVDLINRLLMLGLLLCLIGLLSGTLPHIQASLLRHHDTRVLLSALSVAVGSFGYHAVIPSLVAYLKYDVKALRKTLYIGSLIPLIVYFIWELALLGIIPWEGLNEARLSGNAMISSLINITTHSWIGPVAICFSFFAIATSFLGVSMGLCDFISDTLKLRSKWSSSLVTLIPPLLFAWLYPNGFVAALSYAGVFIALLEAALPALMIWKGRPRFKSTYRVIGGNVFLVLVLCFALLVIIFQVIYPNP